MTSYSGRLFGEYKECEICHKPLPYAYEETICPNCLDIQLFHDVKDFIRAHDVNEYQVAEHFQIPLYKVKEWIKEGRIEYKLNPDGSITNVRCQQCGAPVSFGTLCPKCLKASKARHGYEVRELDTNHKMRYANKDQQE